MKRYTVHALIFACSIFAYAEAYSPEQKKGQLTAGGMVKNLSETGDIAKPHLRSPINEALPGSSNVRVLNVLPGRWEPIGASTIGNSGSGPKWHVTWWIGRDGDTFAIMACQVNYASIGTGPSCFKYKHLTDISQYAAGVFEGNGSHGLEGAYATLVFSIHPIIAAWKYLLVSLAK